MTRRFFLNLACGLMMFLVPVVLSQAAVCRNVVAAEADTDTVAKVQSALNDAGYDCGTPDGMAGSQTTAAITQYQEDKGLTVSGEIDEELLKSLGLSDEADASDSEEAADTGDDESEGKEKGEKGNPYKFGEDIPLGKVYHEDEWAELTVCFDSVLKPIQVLKIDLEDSIDRNFYATATVKVEEISAGDEGKVKFSLDASFYDSDMKEKTVWIRDADDNNSLNQISSYCDYEINVICPSNKSYDDNMTYMVLTYQPGEDADEEATVWVKIPEYWNGEEAGDSDEEAAEEVLEAGDDGMVDGMRVSFKEAMDSYEAFFDEYCEFMTKYNSSEGNSLSMIADYASFMAQYVDTMSKFEEWENEEMNEAEASYYLEVSARILGKLAEVTAG